MRTVERCVLCGKEGGFEPYRRQGNYKIVRCACGLAFVNPRDDEETVREQYMKNETSPAAYYEATRASDAAHFQKSLDRIERRVRPGRLLDVGCGVGTFLDCARARGWKTAGVEPNPVSASVAKGRGHEVCADGPSGEAGGFDCVAFNDTIEHFADPVETLARFCGRLNPGGVAVLATPNLDSFLARLFQFKPAEHLFYFTRGTIAKLLEAAGLRPLDILERGRRRDIGSIHLGATLQNKGWYAASRALKASRLDRAAGWILEKSFKEELFAIGTPRLIRARRSSESSAVSPSI